MGKQSGFKLFKHPLSLVFLIGLLVKLFNIRKDFFFSIIILCYLIIDIDDSFFILTLNISVIKFPYSLRNLLVFLFDIDVEKQIMSRIVFDTLCIFAEVLFDFAFAQYVLRHIKCRMLFKKENLNERTDLHESKNILQFKILLILVYINSILFKSPTFECNFFGIMIGIVYIGLAYFLIRYKLAIISDTRPLVTLIFMMTSPFFSLDVDNIYIFIILSVHYFICLYDILMMERKDDQITSN